MLKVYFLHLDNRLTFQNTFTKSKTLLINSVITSAV